MDRARFRLMEELQAVSSTLFELNLYLETHPDDERAQWEIDTYGRQLELLKYQYETDYGVFLNIE